MQPLQFHSDFHRLKEQIITSNVKKMNVYFVVLFLMVETIRFQIKKFKIII